MEKPPLTPLTDENGVCTTCKGERVIERPVYNTFHVVERNLDSDGFSQGKEEVITSSGGLDACPVCTAVAEMDYGRVKIDLPEILAPVKLRVVK